MTALPPAPPITPCRACGDTPAATWRVTADGVTFVWRVVHYCATPWLPSEFTAVADWNASQERQQEVAHA